MAHVISSFQVLDDLCKAFNIPDTHLTKIVITAQVNDVTTIEVTRLVTDDYKIDALMNKYVLSEIPKERDYKECRFRSLVGFCKCSSATDSKCDQICDWFEEKEKE